MRIQFAVVLLLLTVSMSCQHVNKEKKPQTETKQERSGFQLYEMSEMAALMEQMYVDNQRIRDRIVQEIEIDDTMPTLHHRLFSAVMTDPSERDLFFETQARAFIQVEEEFYADPNQKTKEKFNAIVQACLSCHQKKCGGPIPRIKKLLIP
ncbi:hypothetical protein [Myroides sp. WP-1]|uniref:hypothetical protein n=1 Tax=Myroides sp. WP-1 TaxID=2759944 RepID=UPI0021054803|nr:hypothetical protein [Myroides sp. WP-1]